MIELNRLIKLAFENAKNKGFHESRHTDAHYMMLVACELCEAVEADRENRRANRKEYEGLVKSCDEAVMPSLFEVYIKDTMEDELADAVIRLLDYMGMKGYEIPEGYITRESIRKEAEEAFYSGAWNRLKTFAEQLFVSCVINLESAKEIPESTIYSIFVMAELYGIDLLWHVREKMRYNETRVYKHGKSY